MAIGEMGLAALGVGADLASTAFGNRLQTRAAHHAQDFSAQQFAKRYQTQVADLRAAGLNPMLAYGQSPGSGPSGIMPQQRTPENISSKINETRLVSAQAAKINEETENLKFERKNIATIQYKLTQEVMRTNREVDEIDQRIKTGKAQEGEHQKRQELIEQQKHLTSLQAQLAAQEKNIKRPEEIASGTEGAVQAAHISRVLKPLIDAINGALKNIK